MPAPPNEILCFNKLASAQRQLVTAIWLWFKDADIVSTHTLTAAAFGILNDVSHHRKKGRPIPFDEKYMPKGHEKDIRDLLKSDEVFFKHARKDPDAVHELHTAWTDMYIFSAVKAYSDLKPENEKLHPLMIFLVFWFGMTSPELFEDLPPLSLQSVDIEELKKLSKTEYFQMVGGPFIDLPPMDPAGLSSGTE
jgi:hypothetical protein